MKTNTADVIIIGLGAMGSASSYYLSKKGIRVLGIDTYKPPHNFGSSHGHTRVIREAYHEGTSYVPIVQRSYELWNENEKGETWEYIYFLDELVSHNIPYAHFNRVVPYKENNVIQGFDVLDDQKSERVIKQP